MQGLQNMALNRPVRGTIDVAMGLKDKFFLPENMSGELANLLTSRNLTPIQQQYKAQIMNQLKQNRIAERLLAGSSGPVGSSGEPVNIRMEVPVRSLANQLRHGR